MDLLKPLALIVSTLLVLATALLTVIGGADGRWEHEGLVKVQAPPDRVFEYLTDPEMRMRWVGGLVDSEADPVGRVDEDSCLRETIEVDGQRGNRVLEVTDFQAGSVFAYRTSEGGVDIEMRFTIGAHLSGKRSRIDYHCTAQYPGWKAKVIEPILGHARLSEIEADFERLAAAAIRGD